MSEIRNVTLEILRHGPPHNQLLSPLTQYLALCGNHLSTTVVVPYEHAQFLARQQALRYEGELNRSKTAIEQEAARRNRELHLQITAQEMSLIMAKVPGLISELKETDDLDGFTHFELVISASELALLPFELANAPNGFPGAGQSLTLQSQSPLCMTRRVRRSNNESYRWPDRPRILFAVNLPDADREALLPAHLLALREAIDPWVGRHKSDEKNPEKPAKWVREYMTIMDRASIEDIFNELRRRDYTHLHILAHGVEHVEGVDSRFALNLARPGSRQGNDAVSASRLATMVRAFRDDKSHQLTLPAVVTLACCDGGNGGTVVGAGSSIAHALHEAGIPLVIGSQFPLSFAGSVLMVQVVYQSLLWGEDPRSLLCNLRRQLKIRFSDTHDWASLVAYASFPSDLSDQLEQVRYEQALRCIEAAFSYADIDTREFYETWEHTSASRQNPKSADLSKFDKRLNAAKDRLRELLDDRKIRRSQLPAQQLAFVYGRLAATEKRLSEIEFFRHPETLSGIPIDESDVHKWRVTLKRALKYYSAAFAVDHSQAWALVQELALSLVLNSERIMQSLRRPEPANNEFSVLLDTWRLAKLLSERDLTHEDRIERSCAISNLIELYLLSLWLPENDEPLSRELVKKRFRTAKAELTVLAKHLEQNVGEGDWEIFSRRRQLSRYINWFYFGYDTYREWSNFKNVPDDIPCLIKGLAVELLELLPQDNPDDYP